MIYVTGKFETKGLKAVTLILGTQTPLSSSHPKPNLSLNKNILSMYSIEERYTASDPRGPTPLRLII